MNIVKMILAGVLILTISGVMPSLAGKAPKTSTNEAPEAVADEPRPAKTTPERGLQNAPDTVLVKVEAQAITQADLNKEISQIRQMMEGRGGSPQQFEVLLENVKPQILEGIIVRKLIARESEREKITVSPEETAREIEMFQANLPGKITLDDFLKQNGITRDVFERDVNEQIEIEKLLKISAPTDEEIKAYYDKSKATQFELPETVNARHILIKFDTADDASKKKDKKKKAEEVRKKLIKGGDFAELAEENSGCPSRVNGGNLGEFPRGIMAPAFEKAAFALPTNEISGVVETEFGYHIIQTLSHNPARTRPLEEVKGQIAFRLKGRKVQEKLGALVEKLKGTSNIEWTKEGQALKPAALPQGGLPFMPAPENGAEKEKTTKEPPSEKSLK